MLTKSLVWIVVFFTVPALSGCQKVKSLLPWSSFHKKIGWKAEEYFDDPKVIALCKAIEANDLVEIQRLIKAGADVNAQGKGKMTCSVENPSSSEDHYV